jgi:predicted nucleic acid-binding protein
MTAYYLDTSGLIKRYVTETGSTWVRQLFQPEQDHFFTTCRLTMPEVYSALARRLRDGSVSRDHYDTNIQAFQDDSVTVYRFIELTLDVVNLSRQLLEQHPLRANDAVQLASALIANRSLTTAGLDPLHFLSADNRLVAVAVAEGLASVNPNDHS